MNLSFYKKVIVLSLTILLTRVPQVYAVEAVHGQMVSTTEWVNEESRKEMADKVVHFLDRQDVQQQLASNGLSSQEAKERVAALSDAELQHLSGEIDKASYGGNVVGILVVVLLVILIIYLAKRI